MKISLKNKKVIEDNRSNDDIQTTRFLEEENQSKAYLYVNSEREEHMTIGNRCTKCREDLLI